MEVLQTLWKRSGLWRAMVCTAVLFSGLMILYPIKNQPPLYQDQNTSQTAPSTYIAPMAVTAAQSGKEPKFGETIKEKIYFGGRFVPLPSGDWTVIAHTPMSDSRGTKIDSIALASISNNTLVGLVTLIGNDLSTPIKGGLRSDGNCDRTDINYVNVTSNVDFGPQECQTIDYVNTALIDHSNDTLLRAAGGEIKNKQYHIPTTLIGPTFRFSQNDTFLMVRYLFSPENEGIAAPKDPNWSDSEWNKYTITRYPEKNAYLSRLIIWTNKFLPLMHKAFEGKISDGSIPAEYLTLVP